jgi:hypothetical protein
VSLVPGPARCKANSKGKGACNLGGSGLGRAVQGEERVARSGPNDKMHKLDSAKPARVWENRIQQGIRPGDGRGRREREKKHELRSAAGSRKLIELRTVKLHSKATMLRTKPIFPEMGIDGRLVLGMEEMGSRLDGRDLKMQVKVGFAMP